MALSKPCSFTPPGGGGTLGHVMGPGCEDGPGEGDGDGLGDGLGLGEGHGFDRPFLPCTPVGLGVGLWLGVEQGAAEEALVGMNREMEGTALAAVPTTVATASPSRKPRIVFTS